MGRSVEGTGQIINGFPADEILARDRLTFREILSSALRFWSLQNVTVVFFNSAPLVYVDNSRLSIYGGAATLVGGSTE